MSNMAGYFLALLFYSLGLLSKEMAITLPAIILLYDLVMRDTDGKEPGAHRLLAMLKEKGYYYAGFLAVSVIYLGLRFFVLNNPREALKASSGSLLERIMFLPGHILDFIRLAVFPSDLNADYVFSYPGSFFDTWNLIGLSVVFALAGASGLIYRFSKAVFFGLWWFLITLFPVYNLIEIYHPLAERYLYLPIIGFCLMVPAAILAAPKPFKNPSTAKVVILIPVVVLLSLYATVTIARNPDWQNNFSLWSKTVQSSPNSLTAHGGLGMAYLERGMLDEAAEQFEKTIRLQPDHAKSHYNLGLVYHRKGEIKKALELFKRSLTLNPESVRAHYNLATIYLQQQAWELAIRYYENVNALDPENVTAHYNLGMAYAMQGKLNLAVSQWQAVLQLDPQNRMARDNIQKAKKMLSRAPE